jgi:hypothetical protein
MLEVLSYREAVKFPMASLAIVLFNCFDDEDATASSKKGDALDLEMLDLMFDEISIGYEEAVTIYVSRKYGLEYPR